MIVEKHPATWVGTVLSNDADAPVVVHEGRTGTNSLTATGAFTHRRFGAIPEFINSGD